MTRLIKIAPFILILILGTTSCNREIEFFSTGKWKLDRYYYMDADSTVGYMQTHENYVLDIKINHGFTETQILNEGPYAVTGGWNVSDDIKTLRLYDTLNGTRQYELREATTTSLKLRKDVEEWWLTRP